MFLGCIEGSILAEGISLETGLPSLKAYMNSQNKLCCVQTIYFCPVDSYFCKGNFQSLSNVKHLNIKSPAKEENVEG